MHKGIIKKHIQSAPRAKAMVLAITLPSLRFLLSLAAGFQMLLECRNVGAIRRQSLSTLQYSMATWDDTVITLLSNVTLTTIGSNYKSWALCVGMSKAGHITLKP